ncbi:MAG TPA: hypothetical protein VH394_05650 [Thermoanaerobaculia bacterium]|jgi:hypothetical protein|nr:hypothetical protein [Thermoanaerobaculia bacterium]
MEEDRARWAELIATSLQVSGLSEEDLEHKLGWSPGSLGRLLDGEGDLEPGQVLEILGELQEISRSRKAKGMDGRTRVVAELLERFRLLGYEPRPAMPAISAISAPAEPSSPGELEKKVEAVLRRAYGEPPGGPGGKH